MWPAASAAATSAAFTQAAPAFSDEQWSVSALVRRSRSSAGRPDLYWSRPSLRSRADSSCNCLSGQRLFRPSWKRCRASCGFTWESADASGEAASGGVSGGGASVCAWADQARAAPKSAKKIGRRRILLETLTETDRLSWLKKRRRLMADSASLHFALETLRLEPHPTRPVPETGRF